MKLKKSDLLPLWNNEESKLLIHHTGSAGM
jgi:hypothetical protein